MDFLNNLVDNSILIIPNDLKNKVLDYIDENKLLINTKILTFNQIKKGLLFDYTNETLYEIMKIKNITFETAKDFVENLYFLNEKDYKEDKLKELLSLKEYLEEKGLLIKDELFIDLINSKSKIYIYGFSLMTRFNNYLKKQLEQYKTVEVLKNNINDYKHEVLKFKHIEDEVQYVAEKISELIKSGVDMKKIFISNYSEEYYFPINKIFRLYGIPFYFKGSTKLSDTAIGNYFINNLSDDMDKLLNKIKTKYDIENNTSNNKVFNKLYNLVNTYYWADSYVGIKDLIKEEIKTINIPSDHYENEIVNVNIVDNKFADDEYVFLIGFNAGSIPKTYKDEDYIEDSIKTPLMEDTIEKNKNSRNSYSIAIKDIKNLYITYKVVSNSSKYLPSTLIDKDYIYEINKDKVLTSTYSKYSSKYNKLLYASRLDDLIKFNEEHEDNRILSNSYDIDYNTYDNQFTGISKDKVRKKLEERGYSYSSVSKYFECPFKFYLSKYFRLEEYTTTFSTFIGEAFHKVLQLCLKDEQLDFNQVYDEFIENNKHKLPYGHKEEYFVNSLKPELEFILNGIKEQYNYISITDQWFEEEKSFETDDIGLDVNIKTTINGVVDKCIFNNNDVIIVDYKTGSSAKIDRDHFEYGITIQLPIYLFLLKNINKDFNIIGLYLQHILEGLVYKDGNKTYEQIKSDRLKLHGLTLDDIDKINENISIEPKKDLIRGYQINKEGKYTYPQNIITYEEQNELFNTIKKLLEDCINNSSDGKFDISPIKGKGVNGCEYCSYKDICYVRANNYNYIKNSTGEIEEGEQDE